MKHSIIIAIVAGYCIASCSATDSRNSAAEKFKVPINFAEVHGDNFIVDLKYNTGNNFMGRNLYGEFGVTGCYLHKDLSIKLEMAAAALARKGYKVVLWDCYRPLAVQYAMWKVMPDPKYVADPSRGSNHNRGIAVDCSIVDVKGRAVPMPSEFDEFSEKASIHFNCKAGEQFKCGNREILGKTMEAAGISRFPSEWWHFQLAEPDRYPVIKDK
jgi:zinc D-Ala-D-Ala dipeptidase